MKFAGDSITICKRINIVLGSFRQIQKGQRISMVLLFSADN